MMEKLFFADKLKVWSHYNESCITVYRVLKYFVFYGILARPRQFLLSTGHYVKMSYISYKRRLYNIFCYFWKYLNTLKNFNTTSKSNKNIESCYFFSNPIIKNNKFTSRAARHSVIGNFQQSKKTCLCLRVIPKSTMRTRNCLSCKRWKKKRFVSPLFYSQIFMRLKLEKDENKNLGRPDQQ